MTNVCNVMVDFDVNPQAISHVRPPYLVQASLKSAYLILISVFQFLNMVINMAIVQAYTDFNSERLVL